jgi:transcriptional regulator with XRE-family HTH domain
MRAQAKNLVLLEIRKHRGLLQREVAERAQLSLGHVCQIETGQRRIGLHAARSIKRALRREMDELGFTLEDLLAGTSTALPPRLQNSSVGQTPDPEPPA